MLNFRPAKSEDAEIIHRLAQQSWRETYQSFLSEEQISFMLKKMYEPSILKRSIEQRVGYLIAEINKQPVGFISYVPKGSSSEIIRIEKLYLTKDGQGLGIGKKLIEVVAELAIKEGFIMLELNVNRNNPALNFYKKQGFLVVEELDIPYYQFTLNDFVLQKKLP